MKAHAACRTVGLRAWRLQAWLTFCNETVGAFEFCSEMTDCSLHLLNVTKKNKKQWITLHPGGIHMKWFLNKIKTFSNEHCETKSSLKLGTEML